MHDIDAQEGIQRLLKGCCLLDLRAEKEFARGTLPGASNQPILNDEERRQVGLCYQTRGQAAAIELGHQLVQGEIKLERINGWQKLAKAQPDSALFCWRGGLRSKLASQWLEAAGHPLPRIAGGYKAVRQALLAVLNQKPATLSLLLLGGRTGVGKTELLAETHGHLDLEAMAGHRGSAFGGYLAPQPTPINFEHDVALALLRQPADNRLVLEDEGRIIGRLAVPEQLRSEMQQAGLVVLEASLEHRVQAILQEYIVDGQCLYRTEYGQDAGDQKFQCWLRDALSRIQKRLGGLRYHELHLSMESAFKDQALTGEPDAHAVWISNLLRYYYDPMYDYQLREKSQRILFRGDRQAVLEYLKDAWEAKPAPASCLSG